MSTGLRGRMEAGWSRMNDLIIIQASQGLCAYVLEHVKDASTRGIVIGHDHRHNSERWSKLTAAVFASQHVRVYLHKGLVHTPIVKRLNAACGVMITASHNPKQDNGYKVYWENAVQIIGPHDAGISKAIKENLEPRAESWALSATAQADYCVDRTAEICEAYFAMLAAQVVSKEQNGATNLVFVNTSMHGVGHPFAERAFQLAGFAPFVPVVEQRDPDPEFPTVKFPNPEEKGALDLALKTAERVDATYVLAQDPDADRFSAAERGADGKWITFTGDQLGTLFAARALEMYKASGEPLDKLAMVASTVSSKMIEAMAQQEGFKFVECLTGFKYIGNTALDLVRAGHVVPFGYEEAIGYMFGDEVRDKDGVAAALAFAELVVGLHTRGLSASAYLQTLYARYGFFETSNSYFVCADPRTIDSIFSRIRNFDGQASAGHPRYPTHIAGLAITRIVDLTTGYDSANAPSYAPALPLSSGHMIQFRAQAPDGQTKIVLTTRTSGTEPKIKYYLEGSGPDAARVRELLPVVVAELRDVWMEAGKNALGMP
ncbi:hypothetical protein HWV62_24013 [Athelia sp. TMB]|nr:hypothetical protein HWV62_24013 [Athelia sp. TMB]